MWASQKLEEEEDEDGLGRGLLAGDDSESGHEDGGVPKPKVKFDFYGGVLDLNPKVDDQAVTSSENKSSDDW
jgi:hypothetical protein